MAGAPAQDWSELSDEELARRCSSEVAGCMDELVRRYETRVRDCARRMALDRQQAEDVVQEIFLRLVTSLPRFEGRSAFGTWLYRLAHNTCIDAFRRGRTRAGRERTRFGSEDHEGPDALLATLPARWGDPLIELEGEMQECYLGWVLSQLPGEYRKIIQLRLGEGRSNEEVAQLLGTTVDSVKAKLRRARRRLREQLTSRRPCPFCAQMGDFRFVPSRGME